MHKFIAATLLVVALAGCAGNGDEVDKTEFVDKETFELGGSKGAIAGLFVDDLFRPIKLGETANSQYEDVGFILLQELALEVETNENGEFTIIDLEPGTYTIRVQADRHETTPQRVTVVAGEFAEVQITARRIVEESSTIITEEQTMFAACPVEAVVVAHAAPPCLLDISGDAGRVDFISNYSEYDGLATHMIVEAEFNQAGTYSIDVRRLGAAGGLDATDYASCKVNVAYLRIQMVPGEVHAQDGCASVSSEFDLSSEFQTIMFAWSDTHETFDSTVGTYGAGVKIGVRAKVIQSLFLGEPEVDVDTYCVLCP